MISSELEPGKASKNKMLLKLIFTEYQDRKKTMRNICKHMYYHNYDNSQTLYNFLWKSYKSG